MATIVTKNSSTASAVPTTSDLVKGELAVNVTDKRIFTENASTAIVELGTNPSTITTTTATVSGTLTANGTFASSNAVVTGGTINSTPIGATTASTVRGSTVTATTGFVGGLTGNVVGNVTGNVTGNITGVVTGNVTGNVTGDVTGNVTASSGTSTFTNVTINGGLDMNAGTSATITNLASPTNTNDAATKGYVDTADATKLNLSGGTMSGAIAMGAAKITGLADPTAAQDAATKIYVDNSVQGLDAKASCRAGTTANITLSGAQTIDGVSVIAGDRVLVKDQTSAAENGIYVAAASGWARSADANTWDELVNAYSFVEDGTANANNGFVASIVAGGTLGSTAVTWIQFSGAGQVIAGAGMTKSGNTLDVGTAAASRIVVNADNIDLATSGVTAATYRSVTTDAYGRITGGTNPTTVSGYGLTDVFTKTEINTSLATKLNLTGGTMSGAIAMGTNKITGAGDPTAAQDVATKAYTDSILGSATSAATSAAAAATSASDASTSASGAATSATNAGNSATAAASSAAAAATTYDNFDDRYLGDKSSDPTVDNDGNALLTGALYFNTSSNAMKVYSGSAWAAVAPTATSVTVSQISDYNGTAAELNYTDGVTSPIQTQLDAKAVYPSQSGNAGKFLSTDGTDPSWAEVSASPMLEAVASGTLANGDTVIINADGTVTAAGLTPTPVPVIGSSVEFESGTSQYLCSAYDTNANKVVIAYADANDNNKGKAVVGTVASGAITFGSPAIFDSSTVYWVDIAYDSNANKVVIVFRDDGNSGEGSAIVGTVSGTSISFGSRSTYESGTGDRNKVVFDSSANKVIIAWHNSSTYKVTVGTISGTSISFGAVASTSAPSANPAGLVYDANANKSLLCYRGPSNYGYAAVISVSGTTASIGTPAAFVSETVSEVDAVYDSSNNKTLIVWRKTSTSYGAGIVATISGTSATFGTQTIFTSTASFRFAASFDTTFNKAIVVYYNSATGYGDTVQGAISGTSVTFTTPVTYLSTSTLYNAAVYDPDSERTIISFDDGGDSQKGKALLYTSTTLSTNLTTENYIGISDAAYANGATAKIQLASATDDAQSGLTAGQSYFVQENGSLALTADTTAVFAGTAVSATKLLIGERNIFQYPSQTGNSGKFLTTNGTAASWADTSAGWKLITTVSGTNALTFLLNNVFSDSYYDYIVEGNLDTNSTYPNPIGFEFIKSGGSYQTSDYRQVHYGSEWTGSSFDTNSSRSQYYSLSGQYLTNGPMYLRIQIARPQTSSGGNAYIYVQSQVNALYSSEPRPILSNGGVSSSQDYIGLRIKDFRSGPATLTGSIRVWARKTS